MYNVQCNGCDDQYTGDTKRRLKDRFNEPRRPVDKPTDVCRPATVSEHFLTNYDTTKDISFIPFELIHSNRDQYARQEKHAS